MNESINSRYTGPWRKTKDTGLRISGVALWTKELSKATTEQWEMRVLNEEFQSDRKLWDRQDHNLVASQKVGTKRARKVGETSQKGKKPGLFLQGLGDPALSRHPVWNHGLGENLVRERLPDYGEGHNSFPGVGQAMGQQRCHGLDPKLTFMFFSTWLTPQRSGQHPGVPGISLSLWEYDHGDPYSHLWLS